MRFIAVGLALLPCAAPAQDLMIADFEGEGSPWRSKFSRHEVVQTERAGETTHAIQMPYDFREGPNYSWLRAMLPEPLDARPYKYLSFWLRGDGSKTPCTASLIKRVPRDDTNRFGESSVAAGQRPVYLASEQWQQFSIPLSEFFGTEEVMSGVEQVNFSIRAPGPPERAGTIELDDVKLLRGDAEGTIVQEEVRYPPADIAIADEAAFFGAMDLERPELEAVREAVGKEDWPAAKAAWARHLETRRSPRWLWDHRDRERLVALYEEHFGGMKRAVPGADKVLARDFNWLGVRKQLDHDIEWLQGPVEWTHVLSRFGYWKTLGQAWWATGDDKYADDFAFMLLDWVRDNPVPRSLTNSRGKRGTVWRTLETGIRGDEWFDVMQYFMVAPAFDAEAKYAMTRSLVEQARHLHRYETAFRYGNWQVVECAGLACVGIMLPEFREAAEWRERALHYLAEHMEKDVYPDGAHHELCPGYHGWVMEKFLRTALLAQLNDIDASAILTRHELMHEFLMKLSMPDGRTAPVGDAGRSPIGAQMGFGALLYDRPDMRHLAVDKPAARWVWLLGPEVMERYAKLEAKQPEFTSVLLPHAKYGMMRTGWGPKDTYLLFDCAPWGGGHSHADRLQVTLFAGGNRLLLDSGQYSYDEPLSHEYFRRSRAHNVLLIDGQEQSQQDPELLAWATTEAFDFAAGRLVDEERGLTQTRSALFAKPDYFVLVDHVSGEGEHKLEQLFHLPLGEPEVNAEAKQVRTALPTGANVALSWAGEGSVGMQTGYLPKGGAAVDEAPVAVWTREGKLPARLALVIAPVEGDATGPEIVAADLDSDVVRLTVKWGGERVDEFAIAPELQELAIGDFTCTARAAWVRREGGEVSRLAIAGE